MLALANALSLQLIVFSSMLHRNMAVPIPVHLPSGPGYYDGVVASSHPIPIAPETRKWM